MLLNFIYLVHGGGALVLALLLIFLPGWMSQMIIHIPWELSEMTQAAEVYARFAAASLVLVVSTTSAARQSSSARLRWAAVLSMIMVLLVGVMVAAVTIPFPLLRILAIAANAIFLLAYLWVRFFEPDSIGLLPPPSAPVPGPARALDRIFLVHGALALVLALVLLLDPAWFSRVMMGITWVPGEVADAATVYARFAAVDLVLVFSLASSARRSPSTRVRGAAIVSMGLASLLGLMLALTIPFPLLMILTLLGNAIFLLLYIWILFFKSEQI